MDDTPIGPGRRLVARAADLGLEATMLGAYTSIGFEARRRLERWPAVPECSLEGRTYVVTGATSGIGHETAAALLSAGAAVRSASRNAERAEAGAAELRRRTGNADIRVGVADLSLVADVTRFAAELGEELPRLDGVAHCAGAFFPDLSHTPEGIEANVAVYVLGPHALTAGLIGLLRAAPEPRLAFVSSSGAYLRRLSLGALDPTADGYRPLAAYAHAKRAQIALTHAWFRYQPDVACDAVSPGWCDTPLLRHGLPRFRAVLRPMLRSSAQGADTLISLLSRAQPLVVTDRLWRDRRPRTEQRFPWALGGDTPDDLWSWCEGQLRRLGVASPA